MKDESLENNIVSLHAFGWPVRRLSREFKISRERVDRILRGNLNAREGDREDNPSVNQRPSKLDGFKQYIGEILEKYSDNPPTNQRVLELIRERGYDGGRSILGDYLATVRGSKKPDPVTCVETAPGQRGSHDWSEYQIPFTGSGKTEKIIFFSFILNNSRRQFVDIVEDQKQITLFKCLINAFIYFDGVPKEVKSDNQKACVDQWEYGRPVFNKQFLKFASHYRFRPLTITPRRPSENLKIERPFDYLQRNFLNSRSFINRDDLRKQLREWLLLVNDQRVHRTTGKKPIDMYHQEFASLRSLPKVHYDTSVTDSRTVNGEACIEWDTYFYAVPGEYMGKSCLVRQRDNQVIIYNPSHEQIRCYPLAEKGRKDKYIGRRPGTTRASSGTSTTEVIRRLEEMDSIMPEYIKQVKKHKPGSYRSHLRRVLSLKVNYHSDDIIMAVRRGLRYKVYEAGSIENFLAVNASKKNEIRLFPNKTDKDEK